jgi:transposase
VRRKQRLTAHRIHVLLQEAHGYAGSEVTVRRAVREVRERLGYQQREAFVPLEYEPGVDGQVDFFEG